MTQETWSLEESRFHAKYISALCGIFCIVILTVSAQPDPRGRVGAVEKSAGFKSFSAQLTSGCRQALNQSCTPVTTTSVEVQTMSFTSMASLLLKGGHLHNFPAFHQTVHKYPSRGAASQANLMLQPKCDQYSSKISRFPPVLFCSICSFGFQMRVSSESDLRSFWLQLLIVLFSLPSPARMSGLFDWQNNTNTCADSALCTFVCGLLSKYVRYNHKLLDSCQQMALWRICFPICH